MRAELWVQKRACLGFSQAEQRPPGSGGFIVWHCLHKRTLNIFCGGLSLTALQKQSVIISKPFLKLCYKATAKTVT